MNTFSEKFWAIVPAAGIGKRFGSVIPKQYLKLGNKAVILHTLTCLLNHPRIQQVVLVLAQEDRFWAEIQYMHPALIIATGGEERIQSVYQGLLALEQIAHQQDWILVHDAVRPCLTHSAMDRLIYTLQDDLIGGLLGLRVRDTLKLTNAEGYIHKTLDRTTVWQAQTPQMFRKYLLKEALISRIEKNDWVNDEAHAIECLGKQPQMVLGCVKNIKITYPEDLQQAALYL